MDDILNKIWLMWPILGFYRGFIQHKFLFNKRKYPLKTFYFVDALLNGFMFSFAYSIPFILPFIAIKEIKRLEICIRNMKDEYDKEYYYNLF